MSIQPPFNISCKEIETERYRKTVRERERGIHYKNKILAIRLWVVEIHHGSFRSRAFKVNVNHQSRFLVKVIEWQWLLRDGEVKGKNTLTVEDMATRWCGASYGAWYPEFDEVDGFVVLTSTKWGFIFLSLLFSFLIPFQSFPLS